MRKTRTFAQTQIDPSGWPVKLWCRGVGIAYNTFFTLDGDLAPRRTRVRNKIIVLESPPDWLSRIEAAGGIPRSGRAAAHGT
jgi:hypothetical protein